MGRTLITLGDAARRLGLLDENGYDDVFEVVVRGGQGALELAKDEQGRYRVVAESLPV